MYTKDPDQELRLDKSQLTVIATVMALVAEGFGDQKYQGCGWRESYPSAVSLSLYQLKVIYSDFKEEIIDEVNL